MSNQHNDRNLNVPAANNDGKSKILRIPNQGEAELFRERLEQFGALAYLENHFSESNDIIVKFKKLDASERAYEDLCKEMEVSYVPTKIDSDRVN